MGQEQLHGGNVTGLRGPQQGSGPNSQHAVGSAVGPQGAVGREELQLQVRIRAGDEQLLDQLQTRGLIF